MASRNLRRVWLGISAMLLALLIFSAGGCSTLIPQLPPSASSTPTDKKYPAAVLVGTQADVRHGTVRNSSAPLPAGETLYFSVRSFGGFGTRELTAVLLDLTDPAKNTGEKQSAAVYTAPLPVEAGNPNVLGTLPPLSPGKYRLTIYRMGEDIAAREFLVE